MDNTKPIEILVYEFLQENVDAAADGSALSGIDVHDTVWQAFKKDMPKVLRVSDAVGRMVPIGEGQIKEFDVAVEIACAVKIEGVDKKARQQPLCDVFNIQKAVVGLLFADQTLGNRVCDILINEMPRSYDSIDGNPYAVANIGLIVNPWGRQ